MIEESPMQKNSNYPTPIQGGVRANTEASTMSLEERIQIKHAQSASQLPVIGGYKRKSRNGSSVYDGPVKPETELHRQLSLPPQQEFIDVAPKLSQQA